MQLAFDGCRMPKNRAIRIAFIASGILGAFETQRVFAPPNAGEKAPPIRGNTWFNTESNPTFELFENKKIVIYFWSSHIFSDRDAVFLNAINEDPNIVVIAPTREHQNNVQLAINKYSLKYIVGARSQMYHDYGLHYSGSGTRIPMLFLISEQRTVLWHGDLPEFSRVIERYITNVEKFNNSIIFAIEQRTKLRISDVCANAAKEILDSNELRELYEQLYQLRRLCPGNIPLRTSLDDANTIVEKKLAEIEPRPQKSPADASESSVSRSNLTWRQYRQDCGLKAQEANTARTEKVFREKYESQEVCWIGEVVSLTESLFGNSYSVSIQMDPTDAMIADIILNVPDEFRETVMTLNKGDKVEFTGTIERQGGVFTSHAIDVTKKFEKR